MTAALNWLISIGGSPVDALLMFFIVGILMMWWNQKRARDAEVKELYHKYNQQDKLIGKYGVAIQCKLGIQLVAEHYSRDFTMTEALLDNLDKIADNSNATEIALLRSFLVEFKLVSQYIAWADRRENNVQATTEK